MHTTDVQIITAMRSAATPLLVSDLAAQTGLSRPTVVAGLRRLVEEGWVGEEDAAPTGRPGPPAHRYQFRSDRGVVVGVDVGLRSLRVVTCDLTGRVLSATTEPLRTTLPAGERFRCVVEGVQAASERCGIAPLRVGIGVPGVVSRAGGMRLSRVIPDWTGVDLGRAFGREIGCSVVVENDTKLAALAEARIGAGTLAETMLLVWIGHRVSSAVVIDGRLHRGWHGIAGELTGSTEMSWTRDSIRGQWAWSQGRSPVEVIAAAERGDAAARAEVEAFVDEIAAGVSLMVAALDPNVIVVGGIAAASGSLTDPLREAVQRRMTLPVQVSTLTSRLGGLATAMGGAVMAFESGGAELTARDGVPPVAPHGLDAVEDFPNPGAGS